MRRRAAVVALFVAGALAVREPSHGALAQAERAPLILVSLDGFRWDYFEKAPAPNLLALVARGVKADALIPVFPSKTFPNHYTIVTGLYPGHHGIVANDILDPETHRTFALSKASELRDPMWWGGEPIWVTAERAGLRAGTMFWPGSEAPIGGVRPTYWRPYDESLSGNARVDQVLEWLDRPAGRRATFLTLYFEDTDTAGHESGPDSDAVRRAITRVDGYVGRLMRGLERRKLAERANVIVLSDHGMAATIPGQVLTLSDYIPLSDVEVSEINPGLGLFPKAGRETVVYEALRAASVHLKVYRRAETPESWHYRDHKRIPPIVGVVDEGWEIVTGSLAGTVVRKVRPRRGIHGYDPALRSMHGIFLGAGPAFRRGVSVPAFENVHVYHVLAKVLGVPPAPNDADVTVANRVLR